MGGTRNTGSVRLPQLTGVLFGGPGQQVSEGQPLFVTLPGRSRYAVPVKHVPKILMYTGLRERLALDVLPVGCGRARQHPHPRRGRALGDKWLCPSNTNGRRRRLPTPWTAALRQSMPQSR